MINQISKIITYLVSRYDNNMRYSSISIKNLSTILRLNNETISNIINELNKNNIIITSNNNQIINGMTKKGIIIGYRLSHERTRYYTKNIGDKLNNKSLEDYLNLIYTDSFKFYHL